MKKEGQVRIPSGCAIAGIFSRSGERIAGDRIVRSIASMHDRSNGLGGGFAGILRWSTCPKSPCAVIRGSPTSR